MVAKPSKGSKAAVVLQDGPDFASGLTDSSLQQGPGLRACPA